MTRSFDAFDRDDFRSPDEPDRGTSGSSESFWSLRVRLSQLHTREESADARDREDRDRPRQERPLLHREERVREILAQRVRTVFRNRDKTFELRDSEIHLLSEVRKVPRRSAKRPCGIRVQRRPEQHGTRYRKSGAAGIG
jgi:hypothetical protein